MKKNKWKKCFLILLKKKLKIMIIKKIFKISKDVFLTEKLFNYAYNYKLNMI